MQFDVIIKNGLFFDGSGTPGVKRDLGIRDGRVVAISAEALHTARCPKVIDAEGRWVMPGMIDIHTHYDAELLASPALFESVRHGVTTVTVGSCSISMLYTQPEDASDIFTRVESIPREHVLPLLEQKKSWQTPAEWVEFINRQPLGPNVCSFVGHSDLRVGTMGLHRAVDGSVKPDEQEMQAMEQRLQDALDAGMLGFSSMTNPWDKLDGDRERSKSLPSTYARWQEYRRFHRILRDNGAILQSAPNLNTKYNAILFLLESIGIWRRKLKTTLITLLDSKADPWLHRLAGFGARLFNRFLGADFRWQALPQPFGIYADGVDIVIFEEFGAGQMALHLTDELQRKELFADPAYREQFKKDYKKKWGGRVWHRDFGDAWIADCPDETLKGKTIAEVAEERGEDAVDTFLDLVIDYGKQLRWHTTMGNHRPDELRRIVSEPATLIGFSDAGAHIRNMAFYNFGLHLLKMSSGDDPVMPIEKAIWRLTGEIGDWFELDAGKLAEGSRADIAIIDPVALQNTDLAAYHEAPLEAFGNISRMVNRNDAVVAATLINGRVAWEAGHYHPDLGQEGGFGQFLPRARNVPAGQREAVAKAA